jgi:hypothetical protein
MTNDFFRKAMDALQFMDELGGPDKAREYASIMRRIAQECETRAEIAEAHAPTAQSVYSEMGFHLVQTGGGCTAYRRDNVADGTYVLITAEGEPEAPTFAEEGVEVGLYALDSDGQQLAHFAARDSDAVKHHLSNGVWVKS